MHGIIPPEAQRKIFPSARSCPDADAAARSCRGHWFTEFAEKLWPEKPSAALYFLWNERVPERTCRAYVSGEREMPAYLLIALMSGRDGERVTDELICCTKSGWAKDWRRAKAALAQLQQWQQLDLGIE